MSLNWREIALIVSELPLEGSLIQHVNQIGFNALVFEMHHPREGSWELYVEVGTPASRLHRISGPPKADRKRKTVKLQRFIQFLRAHIEGMRVNEVQQIGQDRLLRWKLTSRDSTAYLILRFYSGAGSNVIVCDESMMIRELLFRRPGRNEIAGYPLVLPESSQEDDNRFPVRPYPGTDTFNHFIEETYKPAVIERNEDIETKVQVAREAAVGLLQEQLDTLHVRLEKTAGFDSYRIAGDLLNANRHLITSGAQWVEVHDFTNPAGGAITIALDPARGAQENIESYYQRYRKGKAAYDRAQQELQDVENRLQETQDRFDRMLATAREGTEEDRKVLESSLQGPGTPSIPRRDPYEKAPGLRFSSGLFTVLVGRNARENDELLRRWARGNDWWMHTRDTPGGYVFIKSIPGKTIPLETILDGANLALLYSKAKGSGKGDLYYTQVKYLKRPKGGKAGLVLPTQEKNLSVQLDEDRIKRLFLTKKES